MKPNIKIFIKLVQASLQLLFIALIILILRKIFLGHQAMRYVNQCSSQVDYDQMVHDKNFRLKIDMLPTSQPTLILMLNKHALNITLNWLCNTRRMPNVHQQSLIVTLDEDSDNALSRLWPNIRRLHWKVPCLMDSFNYGDGRYQLFYLFRANFARALLSRQKPFWMIQQDTFWRKSLFDINGDGKGRNVNQSSAADIVFDRAVDAKDGRLIAGGYYHVRPTISAKAYFDRLANDIRWCAVTNWIWLYEPWRFPAYSDTPMLIQFDGDTKLGGKLAKMKSMGFYFLNDNDNHTCNEQAVEEATRRVQRSNAVVLKNQKDIMESQNDEQQHLINRDSEFKWKVPYSYSHLQFGLYQSILDKLYKTRATEWLLNNVIFPYAHYFMISL